MSAERKRHVTGKFNAADVVGQGVAGDHQPGPVALFVIPQLPMFTGRIVTQVQIVVECLRRLRRQAIGTLQQTCITEVDEL